MSKVRAGFGLLAGVRASLKRKPYLLNVAEDEFLLHTTGYSSVHDWFPLESVQLRRCSTNTTESGHFLEKRRWIGSDGVFVPCSKSVNSSGSSSPPYGANRGLAKTSPILGTNKYQAGHRAFLSLYTWSQHLESVQCGPAHGMWYLSDLST